MRFDILTAQTYERLAGVKALLDPFDDALPAAEARENEALREFASGNELQYEEFRAEETVLDVRFRHWLPRYAAYSVVLLLFSVFENQLIACARRASRKQSGSLSPTKADGGSVAAAKTSLQGAGVAVTTDPDWDQIMDLRDLRHLIAHRVGMRGNAEKHRETAGRLEKKYGGRIAFPDTPFYNEVWVSLHLCREWIAAVAKFFNRIFAQLDMPALGPGLGD